MGAQQSTRKLTIDNDDPTNVIKVSDSVVDRLKGSHKATPQNVSSVNTSASNVRTIPITPPSPESTPPPSPTASGTAQAIPIPATITPEFNQVPKYKFEPAPTSAKRIPDKETVIRKQDAYWQSRINQLEDTHDKINKIMEQEYNAAINEVNSEFSQIRSTPRGPICPDVKKAVVECYKKYPNQPMMCAKAVQEFAECVDKHRTTIVAGSNSPKS